MNHYVGGWFLFDSSASVYSCSHLSLSGCALASVFCIQSEHKRTVSVLRTQNKLEHSVQEKLAPGLGILKWKACLFVQPQFQEQGRECGCVARRRDEQWASAVIFTARESHRVFLSIPLNQETSGRNGRRIRLAREGAERGSGLSNPDGGFRGIPITVEKHAVRSWDPERRVQDSLPH